MVFSVESRDVIAASWSLDFFKVLQYHIVEDCKIVSDVECA